MDFHPIALCPAATPLSYRVKYLYIPFMFQIINHARRPGIRRSGQCELRGVGA
jgi:hypothetical protein